MPFSARFSAFARHAGLDASKAVIGPKLDQSGHVAEIHDHPARDGQRVAFKRGAGTPADQRHAVGGGPAGEVSNFGRGAGEGHRVGQAGRGKAFALPVFSQHGCRKGHTVAEPGLKVGKGFW